jgi:hypothetical protein
MNFQVHGWPLTLSEVLDFVSIIVKQLVSVFVDVRSKGRFLHLIGHDLGQARMIEQIGASFITEDLVKSLWNGLSTFDFKSHGTVLTHDFVTLLELLLAKDLLHVGYELLSVV